MSSDATHPTAAQVLLAWPTASFNLTTSVAAGTENPNASTGTHAVADGVGNSSTAGPVSGNKVDKKAPTITDGGPTTSPNGAGWYKTAVLNGFSAADTGSGLSSACNIAFPKQASTGTAEGTSVHADSGACSDAVGNTNAGISSVAFKIDLTDPTVTCPAVPTFVQSELPKTITATVTDGLSGPASPTASGTANSPSGGTVDITGQDSLAGNSKTVACAYHVGNTAFFAPVDKAPIMNIAKLGRVVPVKVSLVYDGAPVTATGTLSVGGLTNVNCSTGGGTDAIDVYAAGASNTGNLFRWDSSGPFWIYNFDTSAFKMNAGNCYRINVYYGGVVTGGNASGGALVGYFLLQTTK